MANEFKIKKGLIVTGADGGTVVDIQGSQGQLFSVTDDLSGSIFAVSDISGVPILDVNSNGTIQFSDLGAGTLVTDANGNISVSSGGGAGGPYLPLAAGSGSPLTGDLYVGTSTAATDRFIRAYFSDNAYTEVRGYGIVTNRTGSYYRPVNDKTQVLAIGNEGNTWNYISQNANYHTFGKDTSEWMRIDTSGNVGIGITSPTNPLTVDFAPYGIGNITTSNNATAWNTSSAIMLRGASGSNGLGFGVSGTANDRKSWIQSGHPGQQYANYLGTLAINPLGGAVGIGTTSPFDSRLEVAGRIRAAGGTSGGYFFGSEEFDGGFYAPSDGNLAFATNNAERIRIDGNGNLGINETNPGVKLQVITPDEQVTNFSSSVVDQLIYSQISSNSSTAGVITGAAALELVGKANASGHGRHAWIGAEGTPNTSTKTKLKFKVRGETATGYDWAGAAEAPTIMTLEGDGNVGIGTTSPGTKLTVSENAAGLASSITNSSSSGSGVQITAGNGTNNSLQIRNYAGGELMRVQGNGNVGIGTTSPTMLLDVGLQGSAGAGDFKKVVVNVNGGYSTDASLQYKVVGYTGTTRDATDIFAQTTGEVVKNFYTGLVGAAYFNANRWSLIQGGVERLTVQGYGTNVGNVGIGTTNPTTHLEVVASQSNSSIRAGGLEMQSYAVNNSWYAENLYYGSGGWKLRSNGYATQMYMQDGKITFNRFVSGNAGDTVTPYSTMILASNGNVGIGVTGPGEKLTIGDTGNVGMSITDGTHTQYVASIATANAYGNGSTVGQLYLRGYDGIGFSGNQGGATHMTLLTGGNVGIGTTTPLAKLDIQGTQGQLFSVTDDLSGDIFSVADISGVPIMNVNSDGTSYFDGNVGIGTDAPGYTLEIAGPSTTSFAYQRTGVSANKWGFHSDNDATYWQNLTSGNLLFTLQNGGNVGIGTTSPGAKLEVEGDATSNDTPQLIVASGGADNNAIIHFTDDAGSQVNAIGALEGNTLTFASQNELVFKTNTSSILGTTDTKMTIDTNGKVGIGTTSPLAMLHIDNPQTANGNIGFILDAAAGGTGTRNMHISVPDYGEGIRFLRSGTYSGGAMKFYSGTSNVGGVQINASSTSFNTTSDYRAKENVVPMENSINRLKELKPCRFNFIIEPENTVDGFIAHEAQEVVPEAVTGEKDKLNYEGNPEYQGIDQSKIVPLLTSALQEAISKIEQLETRIQTLENN